jgi:hypothetical protein
MSLSRVIAPTNLAGIDSSESSVGWPARLCSVDHGDSPHTRDAYGVGILTGRTPKAHVTTGTGSAN